MEFFVYMIPLVLVAHDSNSVVNGAIEFLSQGS